MYENTNTWEENMLKVEVYQYKLIFNICIKLLYLIKNIGDLSKDKVTQLVTLK